MVNVIIIYIIFGQHLSVSLSQCLHIFPIPFVTLVKLFVPVTEITEFTLITFITFVTLFTLLILLNLVTLVTLINLITQVTLVTFGPSVILVTLVSFLVLSVSSHVRFFYSSKYVYFVIFFHFSLPLCNLKITQNLGSDKNNIKNNLNSETLILS